MKKMLIKIGNLVAVILMFSPIFVLFFYKLIGKYWWILLILSICYDAYMYSNILNDEYIKSLEEKYKKWIEPNKVLDMEFNDTEHLNICKDFIEEIINKLKKD